MSHFYKLFGGQNFCCNSLVTRICYDVQEGLAQYELEPTT